MCGPRHVAEFQNYAHARSGAKHRFKLKTAPKCICGSVGIADHDEAHFWLNGYVNKQNCRIWSEANPQVYVETPLHPEKLTV
ncbi:hypothetical protein TNCV_4872701 [Trichonephila clavipes]|nr:hypothetical protein TNCV_4872701 [Trichonephila clavipes]